MRPQAYSSILQKQIIKNYIDVSLPDYPLRGPRTAFIGRADSLSNCLIALKNLRRNGSCRTPETVQSFRILELLTLDSQ